MGAAEGPGKSVVAAFAPGSVPALLAGGQGRTFAVGPVVLKPVEAYDEAAWTWVAETLTRVVEDGFRIARPVRARCGRWIVDGWMAFERVSGDHRLRLGPWGEVVELSRRFHLALVDFPRPDFIDHRMDRFARADRAAWGETSEQLHPAVTAMVDRLTDRLRPLRLRSQLIHGDFAGNLLFASNLPPAVIDFSPYWRPAGYATAQVIIDAVLWYGADVADLAAHAGWVTELDQLLLRALLFRLTVDGLAPTPDAAHGQTEVPDFIVRDLAAAEPLAVYLRAPSR